MKNFWKSLMIVLVSVFALASCEDVPAPYPNPDNGENGGGNTNEEVAPAGEGTLENPYNVAGVLAYIEGLGADVESSTAVYVKGKVLSNNTSEATITQYGNMTFDIIDEGNTSKTFKAFQVYGPGNKKFTAVDQIKEGDEVIVYGKVVNYKGNTPETVGKGQAYVVSINDNGNAGGDTPGEEIAPIGDGTAEAPFNVAAALAYIETLGADVESATAVYVKGKVLSNNTTEATITQYGNMTFDIIDEGNTSKTFKAFQVYGPGNQKFTAVSQIKEGDEVIVYGNVVNYKGNTPETVGKGQAYVVSINGKEEMPEPGEDNPGGDTPGGDTPNEGADASFVMASAFPDCNTNTDAGTFTLAGVQFSFAKNGGNNIPKYYWNSNSSFCSVRMYALNSMTIKADKKIAKAVIHCPSPSGSTNYNGNATMTTTAGTISQASDHLSVTIDGINSDTFTLTNHHTGNSGGVQLRIVSVDLIYAD